MGKLKLYPYMVRSQNSEFEFGVNAKFGGGTQKLHANSIQSFLKRGTLAGGSGAAAPRGQKYFENFTIVSMKK